jgi:hypothetical protein
VKKMGMAALTNAGKYVNRGKLCKYKLS